MALENWEDKINGKDYINANDINNIAHAVLEIQDELYDMGGEGFRVEENANADDLVNDGIILCIDPSIGKNFPFTSNSCFLFVQNFGRNQICFYNPSDLGEATKLFARYKLSNTHWQPWVEYSDNLKAVLFTHQDLTESQKEQARKNIGAELTDGVVQTEHLANNIPLSKFVDDIGAVEPPQEVTYTPELEGFLTTSGNFVYPTVAAHTDYISLDGYVKIRAYYRLADTGYVLAFYDAGKNLLSNISVKGAGANSQNTLEMDVPTSAAYVMFSHYRGTSTQNFEGYITLYTAEALAPKGALDGKTINALGDSITSDDYTTPTWWQIIGERTGAAFNDYGVSGTSIGVRSGRTDSFVERVSALSESADAVIVMGGTNDFGSSGTPRGAWNSTETTTLFGALNTLFSTLCENFVGKPILVCAPIQRASDLASNVADPRGALLGKQDTDTLSIQLVAEAVKAKAEQYGLPCLDLYKTSGISGADSGNVYYRTDGLHPSAAGQNRLANIIQSELEKLFK